jgi:UDP-N-acetylmuramate dehydrogenase
MMSTPTSPKTVPTAFIVPSKPEAEVKASIESLLQKRFETQPHIKTAGSCFKALPDGTPAWKLIEVAGLRGAKAGGVEISEKHANFLLNTDKGTFQDVLSLAKIIKERVPQIAGIEMRLYGEDGTIAS